MQKLEDAMNFAQAQVKNIIRFSDAQSFMNQCLHTNFKSCAEAIDYYKNNSAFYHEPKIGDQIFITGNRTGIVNLIVGNELYAIEAGLSFAGSNDLVMYKKYAIRDNSIIGYGRPQYKVDAPVKLITPEDVDKALEGRTIAEFAHVADVDGSLNLSSWKSVKRGTSGDAAKVVQMALIKRGYSCIADGVFGADSVAALKLFQKDNKMIVDGIAGKAVARKLFVW